MEQFCKDFFYFLSKSILGGICIAIAGIVYLSVGGVIGAILFSFGLLAVVHWRFALYTGLSGFTHNFKDILWLFVVLLGNIIGCFLVGYMIQYSQPTIIENAVKIYNSRLLLTPLQCGLLGIGCGFIMTTAVKFAKDEDKYLPLLFGVPVFILCGFLHSIADAFYISVLPFEFLESNFNVILYNYIGIVISNFIGCNLVKIIRLKKEYLN